MPRKREKADAAARALVAGERRRRKDFGVYYTPPQLCRFLAERTLALVGRRTRNQLTVCDPMAGGGAFLEAVQAQAGDSATLYGVDIDPQAVRLARRRLGLSARQVKLGNALVSPITPADRDRLSGHVNKRQLISTLVRERLEPVLGPHTARVRPFCWELEFPEVFFRPDGRLRPDAGFDIVIGNPPWNNLRPDDREFFASYDASFRLLPTRAERDRRAGAILRSAAVRLAYEHYLDGFRRWNALVRCGRFYQHQGGPVEGFRAYKIEHNLYKLALERAWELAKPGGVIGMLVPAGFLGDLGATQLRRLYFEGGRCHGLWTFSENAGHFDAAQAFVAIVFEKAGAAGACECSRRAPQDDSPLAERADYITPDLLRRVAPRTYSIPELHSPHDPVILEKLHRHPPLGEINPEDPWVARPARELHTRDDRDLFVHHDTGIPALKGSDIEGFSLRRPFRLWVDPQSYAERGKDSGESRVAWRAIANVYLTRRLQAVLIPPRHALLNSLNYFIPEQPEAVKYYLLALLNSLVLEWRVRQLAKNNNVNQYVIASLPVPRLMPGEARFDSLVGLSRRLTSCSPLPRGGEGSGVRGASHTALRAELDARVAILYELTHTEFAAVLAQFPRLPAAEKQRVLEAHALVLRSAPVRPAQRSRRQPSDAGSAVGAIDARRGARIEEVS